MLSTARFGQNAFLLNLAVETFERRFKGLVFADFDFRHQGSPPCGLFLRCTVCISLILDPSWTCGKIIVQALSHVKIFWKDVESILWKDCAKQIKGVQYTQKNAGNTVVASEYLVLSYMEEEKLWQRKKMSLQTFHRKIINR